MSSRREFITLLGGVGITWPLAARGQAPAKLLRLGIISASPRTAVFLVAFDQRLRELGCIEGQHIEVDFIFMGDRSYVVGEAMREIVRRKVDVIVDAIGTQTGLKAWNQHRHCREHCTLRRFADLKMSLGIETLCKELACPNDHVRARRKVIAAR